MQRALIYDIVLADGPRGNWAGTESKAKGGRDSQGVACLRGRVVFDKSFVIMALACAAAPIVGAGVYIVVYLF